MWKPCLIHSSQLYQYLSRTYEIAHFSMQISTRNLQRNWIVQDIKLTIEKAIRKSVHNFLYHKSKSGQTCMLAFTWIYLWKCFKRTFRLRNLTQYYKIRMNGNLNYLIDIKIDPSPSNTNTPARKTVVFRLPNDKQGCVIFLKQNTKQ